MDNWVSAAMTECVDDRIGVIDFHFSFSTRLHL